MVLIADVTFSTEALVIVSALLTGLSGTVAFIFKLLLKSKDDQLSGKDDALATAESRAKSYEEIGLEAVRNLEAVAWRKSSKEGQSPVKRLAPVVPEHSSPTTQEQQDTADLQTVRARLVAATLALGLPAREAAPMEGTPEADALTTAKAAVAAAGSVAEIKAVVENIEPPKDGP